MNASVMQKRLTRAEISVQKIAHEPKNERFSVILSKRTFRAVLKDNY